MTPLSGKHALVTGGAGGIGAAVATQLLQQGAHVTLLGRTEGKLRHTVKELEISGKLAYVVADVTQEDQVNEALRHAAENLGPIAILINNAGQAESAPLQQTDAALWHRMLGINLSGSFYCLRAALPAMRQAGWGRIVNVASTAGLQGYAYVGAYCAAKHGLVGLTRALALELANSGVTVNAVCPGYTDTPLLQHAVQALSTRTGRTTAAIRSHLAAQNAGGQILLPEQVAQAVLRFCLPNASGRNGEIASITEEVSA